MSDKSPEIDNDSIYGKSDREEEESSWDTLSANKPIKKSFSNDFSSKNSHRKGTNNENNDSTFNINLTESNIINISDTNNQADSNANLLLTESNDNLNNTTLNKNDDINSEFLDSKKNLNDNNKTFVIKNGCCRDCMKAFSKSGKSCLCQVPKNERKFTLSEKGCTYCGCKGCNPLDMRIEKRKEMKRKLQNDTDILYRRQRIIDSDDELVLTNQKDSDDYNRYRSELEKTVEGYFKTSFPYVGYGAPLRTSTYIFGYNPKENNTIFNKDKNNRRKRSDFREFNNNNINRDNRDFRDNRDKRFEKPDKHDKYNH